MTVPSEAVLECLELWKKLDAMWDQGLGESEEADELRDRSDWLWYRMTGTDRKWFKEQMDLYEAAKKGGSGGN